MSNKIKVRIKNREIDKTQEVDAIIQDHKIKYLEEDQTIVVYNEEENTLVRENKELKMNYDFGKEKGTVELKEFQKSFSIPIKLKYSMKKENSIEIQFLVEEEPFLYRIEVIK